MKIISGGQTGVDRAGLDFAIARGWEHGGWCPKGRKAEDGVIPPQYQLIELDSSDYMDRTRRNVDESDATLIITTTFLRFKNGELKGGTRRTAEYAASFKPHIVTDIEYPDLHFVRRWLDRVNPRVLNIAGPRESKWQGIHDAALGLLNNLWPWCRGCKQDIDPTECHCGEVIDPRGSVHEGHTPVPMGCRCHERVNEVVAPESNAEF